MVNYPLGIALGILVGNGMYWFGYTIVWAASTSITWSDWMYRGSAGLPLLIMATAVGGFCGLVLVAAINEDGGA